MEHSALPSPCRRGRIAAVMSAVAVAAVCTWGGAVAAELPEAGSARYWVQQGSEWTGYETLEWSYPEPDRFRLVHIREEHTRAGNHRLRRTREISEGTLEGDIAQPETYRVLTATVFQEEYEPDGAFEGVDEEVVTAVRFTDDEAQLEEGEIAAPADVLDPVSHRWQVMQLGLEGAHHERIAHRVVDRGGAVEEISFRVEGRQTVRTSAGTFRTVRLAQELPDAQRRVRWYLAEGWAGLPIRTVEARTARHALRVNLLEIDATPPDA